MNSNTLIQSIKLGDFDKSLENLYFNDVENQKQRYIELIEKFKDFFGDKENLELFSAPGRTEIGGNHTDHNHGRVLAASINLDIIGVASKNDSHFVKIKSVGYQMDEIDLNDLAINDSQENKSISLIRGILARFKELGYEIGGFDCYTTSNVLKGSGLSSSAAFEVLVGTILSYIYNQKKVDAVEIAKIAQYAENVYFKKPCGLMDQMASSVGGIISIDFKDPQNPIIEKVDFDFPKSGYALCIVDTGGNHADLTNEYASIPAEMKQVANFFNKTAVREVELNQIYENIVPLREKLSDRAILRALHFLNENERVVKQVKALKNNDFELFKKLIIESGKSSFDYLQNVFASSNVSQQGLSIALYFASNFLNEIGAYRLHGGGFGGTTQNFVPLEKVNEFNKLIENIFGKGSCYNLNIRSVGGTKVEA